MNGYEIVVLHGDCISTSLNKINGECEVICSRVEIGIDRSTVVT